MENRMIAAMRVIKSASHKALVPEDISRPHVCADPVYGNRDPDLMACLSIEADLRRRRIARTRGPGNGQAQAARGIAIVPKRRNRRRADRSRNEDDLFRA